MKKLKIIHNSELPLLQQNRKKKNKNKFRYIVLLLLLIILIFFFLFIFFYNNIKVCICSIGKSENKYIREFIEYYKQFGIDKIFLYDNNDINGEYFQDVTKDYIKNKYIEIIDFRGRKHIQLKSYKNCYKNNKMFFDWFIIIDIDEYIYLKNYNNIKLYLNDKKFKRCQAIRLNFIYYTDNNLLYYDNRPLKEKFTIRAKYAIKGRKKNITFPQIKSIVRGKISKLSIKSIHMGIFNKKRYNICNGFGNKYRGYLQSDFDNYYIIHYFSKSTEEFIYKIKRGDAIFGKKVMGNIKKYFSINNITLEKINMFEKELKVNLSQYRNILKYIKDI